MKQSGFQEEGKGTRPVTRLSRRWPPFWGVYTQHPQTAAELRASSWLQFSTCRAVSARAPVKGTGSQTPVEEAL